MIRALGFVVFSFFPSFFSSLFYFPSENIVSVLCLFFSQSYLAVDSAVVLLLEIIIFGVSRFLWLISRIHSGLKILISSLLKKMTSIARSVYVQGPFIIEILCHFKTFPDPSHMLCQYKYSTEKVAN